MLHPKLSSYASASSAASRMTGVSCIDLNNLLKVPLDALKGRAFAMTASCGISTLGAVNFALKQTLW